MNPANLPAGRAKGEPAVVLQCYKILRAADDYATTLARLACSKDRVRRMGDSVSRVDAQRRVARDRFAAKVATILQPADSDGP